ncbi:hypothetical protein [Citrobacter sedlakii]|uniref:hypothetical protein n=1 Tax=Citrobacter sedlakii TaxID=67826 RepID=UPI002B22F574|nr:hypothetical protein [Citrobacter sedlakii]MEB0951060.1 hypothetical protein [Citrobacter sedlakii]
MNRTINILPSFDTFSRCVEKLPGIILISASAIFGNYAYATSEAPRAIQEKDYFNGQVIFNQALDDYFADRNREAMKGFNRLKGTDYAQVSAVPYAINLVALGKYSQAKKSFSNLKNSTLVREREYAQLWELWLTAKEWKGSNILLGKTLQRLVSAQNWHPSYMQTIAGLYAGQETVENVFRAVDALSSDPALRKDAFTEATFFAGEYLQNVKHDSAAAKQLFNANLSKLNSVSLERPFIDRACATLNKHTHKSK